MGLTSNAEMEDVYNHYPEKRDRSRTARVGGIAGQGRVLRIDEATSYTVRGGSLTASSGGSRLRMPPQIGEGILE